MTMTLAEIPSAAAAYIEAHGWTRKTMQDKDGAVCLHGAIRECTPQKGDAEIVRAVARAKGYTESWNDEEASASEVLDALRGLTVTDADLAETFGPQWREIVALVRRAATLTDAEARALDAARNAARVAARNAARNAARVAGESSGAAWDAAWDAARNAAQAAAWDAAGALAARDLIGQYGFTREHYDTLTGPWARVIGKVHPDDVA